MSGDAQKGDSETRVCLSCGRTIALSFFACPHCGKVQSQRAQEGGMPQTQVKVARMGGIFVLVGGIFGILTGVLKISLGNGDSFEPLAIGTLITILSVFAILGGVFALLRKWFSLAVLFTTMGLCGPGPISWVGYDGIEIIKVLGWSAIIFCITGLMLVIDGRNEFIASKIPG